MAIVYLFQYYPVNCIIVIFWLALCIWGLRENESAPAMYFIKFLIVCGTVFGFYYIGWAFYDDYSLNSEFNMFWAGGMSMMSILISLAVGILIGGTVNLLYLPIETLRFYYSLKQSGVRDKKIVSDLVMQILH